MLVVLLLLVIVSEEVVIHPVKNFLIFLLFFLVLNMPFQFFLLVCPLIQIPKLGKQILKAYKLKHGQSLNRNKAGKFILASKRFLIDGTILDSGVPSMGIALDNRFTGTVPSVIDAVDTIYCHCDVFGFFAQDMMGVYCCQL